MQESLSADAEPVTTASRKPIGLVAAFLLVTACAIGAAAYAGWLGQQRELLQTQLGQSDRKILDLRPKSQGGRKRVQKRHGFRTLTARRVARGGSRPQCGPQRQSRSTLSSASGSTGLTRWSSAPASWERRLSASWPQPVSATMA